MTSATLETLGDRLAGGEGDDLVSQLPHEIGEYLRGRQQSDSFTLDEFFRKVGEREGADMPDAVHQARALVSVLQDAVSRGEIEDVLAQLPEECAPLFDSGSEGRMPTP